MLKRIAIVLLGGFIMFIIPSMVSLALCKLGYVTFTDGINNNTNLVMLWLVGAAATLLIFGICTVLHILYRYIRFGY